MKPASVTTFTEATFTPGATPAMPTPLSAAAIVPATCVPWLDVVGFHAASGVDDAAEAGRALVLGDLRREVGMRAGDAAVEHADDDVGLPVVTACAAGTPIWVMSHCRLKSGSTAGLPVASCTADSTVPSVSPSSSGVPRPSVEATASTPAPEAAVGEAGVGRAGDENADLSVARDDRAAGGGDPLRCLGRRLALRREHE